MSPRELRLLPFKRNRRSSANVLTPFCSFRYCCVRYSPRCSCLCHRDQGLRPSIIRRSPESGQAIHATILSDLMAEPKVVDFDTQKDAVRFFGARMQSTLIAFKGTTETGRSVGETERSSIAALLNKAL